MTPFDIINSINNKTRFEWDEDAEKTYAAFIVNRGLSFNLQTVLYASMMNQFPGLAKQLQYDFYFNGIPKGKRFDKWQKKLEVSPDIQVLQDFYGINIDRAAEALKLLSTEQLDMIKQKMNKGGRK